MAKMTTTRKMTPTIAMTKGGTKSRSKAIPSEEQIQARAFEIYLRRNGAPGDAQSDWLQAERELAEELTL